MHYYKPFKLPKGLPVAGVPFYGWLTLAAVDWDCYCWVVVPTRGDYVTTCLVI